MTPSTADPDPPHDSMPDPLRVAVIGSGPAGIYTAGALLNQDREPVTVDVLDRLPTPYGLVRYGVAPDHTKIKGVARALRDMLEHPSVRFVGGVEFGRHVSRAELGRVYDAVVYATGASVDRQMDIPGEELPGSIAATDFVNAYSGHPDVDPHQFPLDVEEVAVVGAGNVALDVVRILAKTADELRHTDIPPPMLDILAASKVRRIHLLARRGPIQAKFTAPELRDLGELPSADVVVQPAQLDVDPVAATTGTAARAARANLRYLTEWSQRTLQGRDRTVELRFWRRPVAILGTDEVEGLEIEATDLDENGRLMGTGVRERLDVGMVVRSVGYLGVPLPGVPFENDTHTVPHEEGRVLDTDGSVRTGDYVAGWIKRGATGVIGTNKSDAAATVRSLLDDAARLRAARPQQTTLEDVLTDRDAARVLYEDWQVIEAAEAQLGLDLGRGPRVKLHTWTQLYDAATGRS